MSVYWSSVAWKAVTADNPPAAAWAREFRISTIWSAANIAWPDGPLFKLGPAIPDQLFRSFEPEVSAELQPFSSRKGFPEGGNALKKLTKSPRHSHRSRAERQADLHREGM